MGFACTITGSGTAEASSIAKNVLRRAVRELQEAGVEVDASFDDEAIVESLHDDRATTEDAAVADAVIPAVTPEFDHEDTAEGFRPDDLDDRIDDASDGKE